MPHNDLEAMHTEVALIVRIAGELSGMVGMLCSGLDDASLSVRGTHKSHHMLAEQARTIERVVESLRKRSEDLTALAATLQELGLSEAAAAVESLSADFRTGHGIAAGSIRRWVMANDACEEALKIAKTKMNAAMQTALEVTEVAHLLAESAGNLERGSALKHVIP